MKFQKTPWREDARSKKFSHHAMFGTISVFPKTLGKVRAPVEDQRNTTRCTGYGNAAEGYYIHGTRMSADWQAAMVGKVQKRSVDNYGGDPNACMKAMVEYGFLPRDLAPYSLEKDGEAGSGWDKWSPTLQSKALDTEVSYLIVDGPLDLFDDIRSALVQAYNPVTKRGACVDAFGRWFEEWTYKKFIPQAYSTIAGYHRYVFIDFDVINGVPYLIAQNSYGTIAGDMGFHYFPREVVNREFTIRRTTLKILKSVPKVLLEEAKKETPLGKLVRKLLNLYYLAQQLYGRFL